MAREIAVSVTLEKANGPGGRGPYALQLTNYVVIALGTQRVRLGPGEWEVIIRRAESELSPLERAQGFEP